PKKWVPLELPLPPPPAKPHRTKSLAEDRERGGRGGNGSGGGGGALRERQPEREPQSAPPHGPSGDRRPPARDKHREDRYHNSSGGENYYSDDHSKARDSGGGRAVTGGGGHHRSHDNHHSDRADGYDKRRPSAGSRRGGGRGGGRGYSSNGPFHQRSRSQADAKPVDYPTDIAYYVDFTPVDVSGLTVGGAPAVTPSVVGAAVSAAGTPGFVAPFFTPFPSAAYLGLDSDRLREYVRQQIEYYFSDENLQRDFFLRRKMDANGFLPISLISSFHRVQALTQDPQMVIDSLKASTIVEVVDGVKLRAKVDPEKWPLLDNLSAASAGLHANVPSFIPGQPYGYGYGEVSPPPSTHPYGSGGEEAAADADNEADSNGNSSNGDNDNTSTKARVSGSNTSTRQSAGTQLAAPAVTVNTTSTTTTPTALHTDSIGGTSTQPNDADVVISHDISADDVVVNQMSVQQKHNNNTSSESSDNNNAMSANISHNKNLTADWREVKSKKFKSRSRQSSTSVGGGTPGDGSGKHGSRYIGDISSEELAFAFDEDINAGDISGRRNQFTTASAADGLDNDYDSDYEISDTEVARILVVTQSIPSGSRAGKHEGYDRTGDWTTRVKLTQELAKEINDGLYYYEQDLMFTDADVKPELKPHKTVELISQEAFERFAPNRAQKVRGAAAQPPPPPPPPTYEEESFLEKHMASVISNS
ncbi:unnamed protein product, partial [Medioppia subpectinata]